jgi:Na+/melibiose symporter-like transporter
MLLSIQIANQPPKFRDRLRGWMSPLYEIEKQPGDFLVWFVVAIGIGGLSIWIYPLLRPNLGTWQAWFYTVSGGTLGIFVTVLLANSLVTVIQPAKQLRTSIEEGRRVASSITVLLLITQAMLIWLMDSPSGTPNSLITFQLILVVLGIALATYLQCIRLMELPFPARSSLLTQEDVRIEHLKDEMESKKQTKAGEAL